ncbi:MAG: aldo/keto reductase [Woeseiaceae bacterium]|nr:aldo/keto reductase [Woeseiaceae bacterium]
MLKRPIPSSDEMLPVVGLGTYNVFDVESTSPEIALRKQIVDTLVDSGGSVIDTSPMYNRSEKVIGDIVSAGTSRKKLFLATKVWTTGRDSGIAQMKRSIELMNADVVDLMQVHNLRDTAVHYETIREWQDDGRIRFHGLTHYRAGAHDALEAEMKRYKPQFIQINYSVGELEAEDRILPLAADMGIAVLINRPFKSGDLFRKVGRSPLPDWAGEFAASWGQLFLKFIISHPAVTAVIPATSKLRHMQDNVLAGVGPLPDNATRDRIARYVMDL